MEPEPVEEIYQAEEVEQQVAVQEDAVQDANNDNQGQYYYNY